MELLDTKAKKISVAVCCMCCMVVTFIVAIALLDQDDQGAKIFGAILLVSCFLSACCLVGAGAYEYRKSEQSPSASYSSSFI